MRISNIDKYIEIVYKLIRNQYVIKSHSLNLEDCNWIHSYLCSDYGKNYLKLL